MTPRPRIRKTLKWACAVMVVVLMLAWAVSLRWEWSYFGTAWAIEGEPHRVWVYDSSKNSSPFRPEWTWRLRWERTPLLLFIAGLFPNYGPSTEGVKIPYWLVAAPLGVIWLSQSRPGMNRMQRFRRTEQILKWLCAAMSVVLIGAWAASYRWNVQCLRGHWAVTVEPGSVAISRNEQVSLPDVLWSTPQVTMPWYGGIAGTHATVPIWVPLLACTAVSTVLWRRDKRLSNVERGGCVQCGYDRAGLKPDAVCPECGNEPTGGR